MFKEKNERVILLIKMKEIKEKIKKKIKKKIKREVKDFNREVEERE